MIEKTARIMIMKNPAAGVKKSVYEKIIIGGTLSAFIYSYLNDAPLVINKLSPPFHFKKVDNTSQIELWNKLYFLLSLSGLNLVGDLAKHLRINNDEIAVAALNSKLIKINFKKAIIFDDENTIGLPMSIEELYKTTNKFIVLDWMTTRSCVAHDFNYLQTEDDFVKEIYFYPTNRVAGNHPDQKDLVSISHLTADQMQDFNYSDTYARFKTLKLLKKKGIKGRKNGFSSEKQIYYPLDLKVEKREIKRFRMNLYNNTDKIEFNYSTPKELLTGKKTNSYQSKLNNLLRAI